MRMPQERVAQACVEVEAAQRDVDEACARQKRLRAKKESLYQEIQDHRRSFLDRKKLYLEVRSHAYGFLLCLPFSATVRKAQCIVTGQNVQVAVASHKSQVPMRAAGHAEIHAYRAAPELRYMPRYERYFGGAPVAAVMDEDEKSNAAAAV